MVNHEALCAVLQGRYLLPDKLTKILRALHQGAKGAVGAYGKVSKEFDITTDVRQGDVLAPDLFNLFFDAVIAATLISFVFVYVLVVHGYHLLYVTSV